MKMKKTMAAVCAAAVVVSMAATASLAVDYGSGMNIGSGSSNGGMNISSSNTNASTNENAGPATSLTYTAVSEAVASGETIEINTDKCKLSTAAMSAIAKSENPVSFQNDEGVKLTIDPKKIEDLSTIDLGMVVSKKDNELSIDLNAEGELGLTLEITVPKDIIPEGIDLSTAHVYADGADLGPVQLDDDGNVVIEITSGADIVIK